MRSGQFIDSESIPHDWKIQRLSYGFRNIGSGTTPDTGNDDYYGGEIPWVTTSELRENRITKTEKTVTKTALAEHTSLKLYPPGTLLIAMYGATIGRLGFLGVEACTNQACCALAKPQGLHPRYTFYWLQAYQNDIVGLSHGGGQKNIGQEVIRSLRISAPNTNKQRQIADFLDHRTARIDALVSKQKRLLDLLSEKRQASITRAVTKGLDSTVATKSTEVEWLDEIPEHWDVGSVGWFYDIQLGKMLDEKRISGEHLAPYLRNQDVHWWEVNTEGLPMMDFSPVERRKYNLKKGDVLVCEGGEIGRSAVWLHDDIECYYQKALHRVRPIDTSQDPFYFCYFMEFATKNDIFEIESNKSTIGHLTAEQLRKQKILIPPADEQTRIVSRLGDELDKLSKLNREVRKSIKLLEEKRQALITAAVTGQIDVTEGRGEIQDQSV